MWLALPVLVFNAGLVIEDLTRTDESPQWTHTFHAVLALVALPFLLAALFGWGRTVAAIRERDRALMRESSARHRKEAHKRAITSVLAAAESMRIVYQPVIDLQRGEVVGHEALARFDDGRRPDLWFAEARRLGLGVELEMHAIREALDGFDWKGDGYLAVNASPVALVSGCIPPALENAAGSVVVELTEHVGIDDHDAVVSACSAIRAVGARVAIDDVGNGHATLQAVVDLRPDIIKLDTSLICHLDADHARHELAAALVTFAASVGCGIVAEGIEREAELTACREVGVPWGQGYLLGEPAALSAARATA